MSDWGATHSTVAAANAGLDVEMGLSQGQYFTAPLKAAVQLGQVASSRLNDMVLRIVRTMFRVGVFDHPAAAEPDAAAADVRRPRDITLARTISERGTVLLKNAGNVLPLTRHGLKLAVIGPGAGVQGAEQLYNGAGSGHVPELGVKPDAVSPLQGVQQRARRDGDTVLYADGASLTDAVTAAKLADVAVVFVGSQDGEGTDRPTLDLGSGTCTLTGCLPPTVNQDSLISQVADANPHTVVVLNTGGPVVMPWLSRIKGLFEAWYPGQQDGNAIAALLFGDVDPSARLPETFPRSQREIPTQTPRQFPGITDAQGVPQSTYSEGLLVGYRWYDAKHLAPLFPFGFGLDYTTFAYRKLKVAPVSGRGSDPAVARATIEVRNTGRGAGADVPQLYVADPASSGEPPNQLKGYDRVTLSAHHSERVRFAIDQRALSYWSTSTHSWTVTRGCYRLLIGHDERHISDRATISVDGASCPGAAAGVVIPGKRQHRH
jgi:beta-glucosidase